jgi:hypothetical protein
LDDVMRVLHASIGRTFFEPCIAELLQYDNTDLEQQMLSRCRKAIDRIGVGLALGYFRRVRRRRASNSGSPATMRGPSLVRQRADTLGSSR